MCSINRCLCLDHHHLHQVELARIFMTLSIHPFRSGIAFEMYSADIHNRCTVGQCRYAYEFLLAPPEMLLK